MRQIFQRCWCCSVKTFSNRVLCNACENSYLGLISHRQIEVRKGKVAVKVDSFLNYREPLIQKIILQLKEQCCLSHLLQIIEPIERTYPNHFLKFKSEVILAMPSSTGRLHGRLLAQGVATLSGGVPIENFKWEGSGSQKDLNFSGRAEREMGSDLKFLQGDSLLLVDDLITTGATLIAATKSMELLESKAMTLAWMP